MFKNYLKTAYRSLIRQKGFTIINLVGLVVGMTCSIFIYLWVQNEFSYDKFNKNHESIYRATFHMMMGGRDFTTCWSPSVIGSTLCDEFPEVESYTRLKENSSTILYKNKSYNERNIAFVDSSFLDVFTLKLIRGDKNSQLKKPYTLILSESMAKKYFGTENPLGKLLKINNTKSYEVTGVYENIPSNSHFNYNFLLSMTSYKRRNDQMWFNYFITYFKFSPNIDIKLLTKKLRKSIDNHASPEATKLIGKSLEELRKTSFVWDVNFQHLDDIHLHSKLDGELSNNGDIKTVYIFITISIFILTIACINFINLSTARFIKEPKRLEYAKQ